MQLLDISSSAVEMPPTKVSLLLCTRNRAKQLERCLEAIAQMDYAMDWELIIVDNGSTDATAEVVNDFSRRVDFAVRYVVAAEPGLSRARNVAVASARGEILCFTDDDCYPAPDYLAQIDSVFAELDGLAYMGGRILLHDPEDARVTIKESAIRQVLQPTAVVTAGTIHGANMAIRRSALSAVGPFDEILGAGAPLISGEDSDMIIRLSNAGFLGCYDPRPVVRHHHGRRKGPQLIAQRNGYDVGRGAVYLKAMLGSQARAAYARFWLGRLLEIPRRRALRELFGALSYCFHSVSGMRARSATPGGHSPSISPTSTTG